MAAQICETCKKQGSMGEYIECYCSPNSTCEGYEPKDKEIFVSFIKDPLHIDDVVVYLKNTRTGSSTIRKCVFVGQITGFTKSKVKILQLSKEDQWVYPEEVYPYGEVKVYPEEVICTMWRREEWKGHTVQND